MVIHVSFSRTHPVMLTVTNHTDLCVTHVWMAGSKLLRSQKWNQHPRKWPNRNRAIPTPWTAATLSWRKSARCWACPVPLIPPPQSADRRWVTKHAEQEYSSKRVCVLIIVLLARFVFELLFPLPFLSHYGLGIHSIKPCIKILPGSLVYLSSVHEWETLISLVTADLSGLVNILRRTL